MDWRRAHQVAYAAVVAQLNGSDACPLWPFGLMAQTAALAPAYLCSWAEYDADGNTDVFYRIHYNPQHRVLTAHLMSYKTKAGRLREARNIWTVYKTYPHGRFVKERPPTSTGHAYPILTETALDVMYRMLQA